jgi:hypothetical protein
MAARSGGRTPRATLASTVTGAIAAASIKAATLPLCGRRLGPAPGVAHAREADRAERQNNTPDRRLETVPIANAICKLASP